MGDKLRLCVDKMSLKTKLTGESIYWAFFLPAEEKKIYRENKSESIKDNRVFKSAVFQNSACQEFFLYIVNQYCHGKLLWNFEKNNALYN